MTLIIDSREQASLEPYLQAGIFDEVVIDGLPVGDYWCKIDGKEVPISFERKGLGDLFGTLSTGHDRFKKELERAKKHGLQLVLLIEGTMLDVWNGVKYSNVSGDQILKTIFSLWVRYDLFPVFCDDKRTMARFIEETYTAIARIKHD